MVRLKPLLYIVVSSALALYLVLTVQLMRRAHTDGVAGDAPRSVSLSPVEVSARLRSFATPEEVSGMTVAAAPPGSRTVSVDGGAGGGGGRRPPNRPQLPGRPAQCRMDNCFDYSRCDGESFRVYVYPVTIAVSPPYAKIIRSLRSSVYHTHDPSEACIFVLALDTLDRDPLSRESYVLNLADRLRELPHWNEGRNHIVFNLYSGTWPDYSEHLDFDYGYAMLAKASISTYNFRPNFDISLPLFHDVLAEKGGEQGKLSNLNVPSNDKYLLAFKGKRYLVGIGSETRNFVHHLHNGKDIIMLTTCRHGKDWERYKDDRCDLDNEAYDR